MPLYKSNQLESSIIPDAESRQHQPTSLHTISTKAQPAELRRNTRIDRPAGVVRGPSSLAAMSLPETVVAAMVAHVDGVHSVSTVALVAACPLLGRDVDAPIGLVVAAVAVAVDVETVGGGEGEEEGEEEKQKVHDRGL